MQTIRVLPSEQYTIMLIFNGLSDRKTNGYIIAKLHVFFNMTYRKSISLGMSIRKTYKLNVLALSVVEFESFVYGTSRLPFNSRYSLSSSPFSFANEP